MKCALCNNEQAVENSHIIPHFVFRWLKKTGPTGFLRTTGEPNRRRQDGWKEKLLCPNCEDRFSVFETAFANTVFHPLHSGRQASITFDYERWLLDFAVSVSWRSLSSSLREGGFSDYGQPDIPLMHLALQSWGTFLRGESKDTGPFEQHIIVLDVPVEARGIANSFDLALYMLQGVEFDTVHSPIEAYIFTKLCRILIVGTIKNDSPQRDWVGTSIALQGRYTGNEDKAVSRSLFDFLESAVCDMRAARGRITEKQRKTIDEAVWKKIAGRGQSNNRLRTDG